LDLIAKIAAADDEETNDDPYNWYVTKYKEEPSYSVLLDKLVITPSERMNLLKNILKVIPLKDEMYNPQGLINI
jgi:hypothetical protein